MTNEFEKDDLSFDHYKATIENDSLVMKPYCACGHALNEDYFCNKCNRECHCRQIACDNEATLNMVENYIKKSSQFSGFKVLLA